jgi:hypothetical protein
MFRQEAWVVGRMAMPLISVHFPHPSHLVHPKGSRLLLLQLAAEQVVRRQMQDLHIEQEALRTSS